MERKVKGYILIEGGNKQASERLWPIQDGATHVKIPSITGELGVLELIAFVSSSGPKLVGCLGRYLNNTYRKEDTLPGELRGRIFSPLMLATDDGRVYAVRTHLIARYGDFNGEPTVQFLRDAKMPELADVLQKHIVLRFRRHFSKNTPD